MRDKYKAFSGGLYSDIPEIDVQVAEGRNFVARATDTFDVIQFSQVDTWAAASAGAYSLTENYLYTLDAYLEYLNHLNPDGMLAIGRWHFEPPGQALRLVTIGSEALTRIGVEDPSQHFIVVRAGDTANMFMKKSPFTAEEIAALRAAAEPLFFTVLYAPDMLNDEGNHFSDFFRATDKEAFYAGYPLDVSPTTDDRPFFFEYYGWTNFGTFRSGKTDPDHPPGASYAVGIRPDPLAAVAFSTQRAEHGWHETLHRLLRRTGDRVHFYRDRADAEIHPVPGPPDPALSVVLFALLTASGVGSFLSNRLTPAGVDPRRGQKPSSPRWPFWC